MMMALRRCENLNGEVLAPLKRMECDKLDLLRVKNSFAEFYFNIEIGVHLLRCFQRIQQIVHFFLQVLVVFEFDCKLFLAGEKE